MPAGHSRKRLDLPEASVIAAYEGGATIAEVAKQFGVSRQAIRNLLIRNDVPRRPSGHTPPPRPRNPLNLPEEEIVTAYQDGDSLAKIAAQLGVSVSAIRNVLVRCETPRRPASTPGQRVGGRRPIQFSTAKRAAILERYQQGESPRSIAEWAGCSRTAVERIITQQGGELRTEGTAVRSVAAAALPIDEVVMRYNKGESSVTALAREYGISVRTMQNRLTDAGVSLPRPRRRKA